MLLLMLASAWANEPTVLSLEEALRLLERPEQAEPGPARRWTPTESRTQLRPVEGGLEVVQELDLTPLEPGWVALRLLDGRVILEDGGAEVFQGPDSHWWWVGRLERPTTLRLKGFLPNPATAATLFVAKGVRQSVVGEADGLEFVVEGAVAGVLPPSDQIAVSWRPERPAAPVQKVVQAEVATAAWILDDGMQVRSNVRFAVRRGEQQQFIVRVPGAASELEVTGPRVESWRQSGDSVVVTATGPVAGAMELSFSWRQPLVDKKTTVHVPEPQGVNSSTSFLTLAGDAELLLSPSVGGSLRPTALSELPAWARGVGDATPAAAWSGKGQLQVQTLRLDPIDGPPLVIDYADCVVAFAETGRNLTRCRLDVRNDSEQFLVVRAPAGTELWSARVSGDGVSPVRMDDGSTAVPLERSVETLAGLTAIDVELTFRGELDPWTRRGERELALPAYNAPVARLEWELRLPPTFRGEREAGTATPLSGQDSGVSLYTYSGPLRRGKDEAPPEELEYKNERKEDKQQEYAARDAWNNALRAYQDNDFSLAQGWIDQTLQLDPDNENAVRLQTNLDVFSGNSSAVGGDAVMSRRVKDMAKAKVSGAEIEQEESMRKAEEAMRMGNYDLAIEELEKSLEIAEELQIYEQEESREQSYRASSSSSSLAVARQKKAEMERMPSLAEVDEEEEEYDRYDAYDEDTGGIGGLIGAKGSQVGSGGLGSRGSGLGGGGTADGLGGLGTKGRGSGASGYGSGAGSFGTRSEAPPEATESFNGGYEGRPMGGELADEGQAETLSKEFLERVPAGRSYQSAVGSTPGVISGGSAGQVGGSYNQNTYAWDDANSPDSPPPPAKVAPMTTAAPPPPPPPEPEPAYYDDDLDMLSGVVMMPAEDPYPASGDTQRVIVEEQRIVLAEPMVERTTVSVERSYQEVMIIEDSVQDLPYDFDGVEITGELVKPEGALLMDRKRADYNPLIQFPQDFEVDARDAAQSQPSMEPEEPEYDFDGDYWVDDARYASADVEYARRRGPRMPHIELPDLDMPQLGGREKAAPQPAATPQAPPTSDRVAQPQAPPSVVTYAGEPDPTWSAVNVADPLHPPSEPPRVSPWAPPTASPRVAPQSPARRATDPSVLAANPELPKRKPIEATSLAIPLPDHGESIVVGQRLLAPGEVPTLTVTYREPLCDPNCFSR
ncbi:MAG: hypothetical protein H6741_01635 [Alphaproteobacteria bacterium]|nr:hypothetical protein [Alphaproteobacteria bacterium]